MRFILILYISLKYFDDDAMITAQLHFIYDLLYVYALFFNILSRLCEHAVHSEKCTRVNKSSVCGVAAGVHSHISCEGDKTLIITFFIFSATRASLV